MNENIYQAFARVYDIYMESTPYDQWAEDIVSIWDICRFKPKLVLDLGCGTGAMTLRFHKKGYEMIGLDRSPDMLAAAREKAEGEKAAVLFLQQDMTDFELYGTVDGMICVCDGINYLLDDNDLKRLFRLARTYLNLGGLFVFDLNLPRKYKLLGNKTFAGRFPQSVYIWENNYDKESGINEYAVTFFLPEPSGLYRRFEEIHYQKAYSPEAVVRLAEEAGLELVYISDQKKIPFGDIDKGLQSPEILGLDINARLKTLGKQSARVYVGLRSA